MNVLRSKGLVIVVCCVLVFGCAGGALAADSFVTYDGSADKFVFLPNTDLFQDLKGIMPGDVRTQNLTVKNDVANGVKVKLYLRAEPAEEEFRSFLKQMKLTVTQNGESILFSAPASEQGGLASDVCLGTFYSGASIPIKITLNVPLEMGNDCQNGVGVINWVFTAEELPIESTDPIPKTGDFSESADLLPIAGLVAAAVLLAFLAVKLKRVFAR